MKLLVRFGDVYNNENEIVGSSIWNLKYLLSTYEMIALSVPLRRVHPGVQDGSLKQKLLSD
jgi:hypothetical protein